MCQPVTEAMKKAPNSCNCNCTCNLIGNDQQNLPIRSKNRNLTYSFKKVLKNFFKKSTKSNSSSSSLSTSFETVQHLPFSPYPFVLESLENDRNIQLQNQQESSFYVEIDDNMANEKLAVMNSIDHQQKQMNHNLYHSIEGDDEDHIYVPVRYARTETGTYFWTTNLQQPITSNAYQKPQDPLDDDSNVSYCLPYQDYGCPALGYGQDRWAQA